LETRHFFLYCEHDVRVKTPGCVSGYRPSQVSEEGVELECGEPDDLIVWGEVKPVVGAVVVASAKPWATVLHVARGGVWSKPCHAGMVHRYRWDGRDISLISAAEWGELTGSRTIPDRPTPVDDLKAALRDAGYCK
jgi:hypothetical protein